MEYVLFLGGVAAGTLITLIIQSIRWGHGYFVVDPFDEEDGLEGFYTVNVHIPNSEIEREKIILTRDYRRSHK